MAALFADRPELLATPRRSPSGSPSRWTISAIAFPTIRCPTGETQFSRTSRKVTDAGARERYRPVPRAGRGRQIERELALIGKLGLAGYFLIVWDLVNFCRRRGDPGPGPRLGREQRGLLQPGHHRRRSGRDGAAVRALPLRGARRVAGHRSRPAERRSPRAGDPARLRALRRRRRGDDRERDHLPRPQRLARDRQGARDPGGGDRSAGRQMRRFEYVDPDDTLAARLAAPASTTGDRRMRLFARLFDEIQDLPRHLGQHSGGMVIAQGGSTRSCRSSRPACRAAIVIQWDKEDCADLGHHQGRPARPRA